MSVTSPQLSGATAVVVVSPGPGGGHGHGHGNGHHSRSNSATIGQGLLTLMNDSSRPEFIINMADP